jgi:thiaminase/transcriptional activator TenA
MGQRAGQEEREAMRYAFLTSCRYEYMFWDMAYRQEQWAV